VIGLHQGIGAGPRAAIWFRHRTDTAKIDWKSARKERVQGANGKIAWNERMERAHGTSAWNERMERALTPSAVSERRFRASFPSAFAIRPLLPVA
jgi:hypothetical protein